MSAKVVLAGIFGTFVGGIVSIIDARKTIAVKTNESDKIDDMINFYNEQYLYHKDVIDNTEAEFVDGIWRNNHIVGLIYSETRRNSCIDFKNRRENYSLILPLIGTVSGITLCGAKNMMVRVAVGIIGCGILAEYCLNEKSIYTELGSAIWFYNVNRYGTLYPDTREKIPK